MTELPVLLERSDDGIARVTLNRLEARNALNLEMCHLLASHFADLDADDTVRAILLCGNGPGFCAGADLKERRGRDAAWVRARRLAAFAAYGAINSCSRPVVAAVHGHVIGSGAEMAMACDFTIAEAGSKFRFPEPQWGTVGATQRLQRTVGPQLAKDLLLTGRIIGADEALRAGLVSRVVEAGCLNDEAVAAVLQIASASPLAIRLTKQAMDLGRETDLATGVRIEMAAIEHNLALGDWQTSLKKFSNDDEK